MSVLYIRDESGKFKAITTITGEKGEKGDPGKDFEYSDFTPEQLEALRGPAGVAGPAGPVGPAGPKGEPGTPVVDEVLPDGTNAVSGTAVAAYVDVRVAQLGLYVLITGQPVPVTVNKGETATFTVSAVGKGLTYQWQYSTNNGEGWTDSGKDGNKEATLWFVTDHHNGYLYRCVITDANGNKAITEPVMLTVIIQLKITKQPENVTAVIGDTVIFTVKAEGNGLTYQWQWRANNADAWRNTSVAGNQTDTITMDATTARNGCQYRCTIYDASGNMMHSDVVTLTVVSIMITKQPEGGAIAIGDSWTFSVEATGVEKYRWQVSMDGGASWTNLTWAGSQTATMTRDGMNAGTISYHYRCVLTAKDGSVVYTDVVTFTLKQDVAATE